MSKAELVDIVCRVEANPSEVQFRWTFNNSAELIRVPNVRAVSEGSRSTLSYTPQTSMDYGTLLCSASNTVGEQRKPCVFHIILAGMNQYLIYNEIYPSNNVIVKAYLYRKTDAINDKWVLIMAPISQKRFNESNQNF